MAIETKVKLLKYRRTKIIATLGPASDDAATIARLITAGVNVFRLNFSHGDHETHGKTFARVRAEADKTPFPVAILADLCGPKIRVGRFEAGQITLTHDEPVVVTMRDVPGEPGLIPSQYVGLANDVRPGDPILIADGDLELEVQSVEGTEVHCVVRRGGLLKDHKGVNLPGVAVSAPSLTDKDREDARYALGLGADFLALSFVRTAADVIELRELITEQGSDAGIVAKIERPEALEDIDAILEVADAIMVARGDLGVELPPEQVPVAQQSLIDWAQNHQKPVVVATQMLESMVEHGRPTRAEVTDVSHAVSSGADAVMLSAETAAGAYPVQAVKMMDRIARQTEGYLWGHGHFGSIAHTAGPAGDDPLPIETSVARATANLSRDLMVRAIVVASESGTSTVQVSSARPGAPVVAVSTNERTHRRTALVWGALPVLITDSDLEDLTELARRATQELGLATPNDYVLLVRGFSPDPALNQPSITVVSV